MTEILNFWPLSATLSQSVLMFIKQLSTVMNYLSTHEHGYLSLDKHTATDETPAISQP